MQHHHLFIIIFITHLLANIYANEDEKRLLNFLFKKYDKKVRPVSSSNSTINVIIKHTIQQILNVDERQELFHSWGWSSLRWKDAYMIWNPKDYNGIKSINLNPEILWIPDIVLYDDISSVQVFGGHMQNHMQNRLSIDHCGHIVWGLRTKFVTQCHFNIHDFPFDTQSCPFRYGSWSHEKGRIDVSTKSKIQIDYSTVHNTGWQLLNYSSKMITKEFSGLSYESIEFKVVFKRKALCRSLNLLLPPLIVGVLVLLTFMLPAESGERLTLSVTLLLAMIFFMVSVAHLIPGDDSTVPLIYKFFLIVLAQIVVLLFCLIFSMQLHHKRSYDSPMPKWLRKFVYGRLSYWIGTRNVDSRTQSTNSTTAWNKEELESIIEIGFAACDNNYENENENPLTSNELCVTKRQKNNNKYIRQVKRQSLYDAVKDKEIILKEWRIVSLTVDRALFFIFSSAFVTTIFTFSLHATFQ